MASHLMFIGTYTRTDSRGIYSVRLDSATGELSSPLLAAEATDPSWIALSPDRRHLYAVHPSAAQAIAFEVKAADGMLTPRPCDVALSGRPANPPSHLAVDRTGRVLVAANYRDGYVAAVPIRPDGTLGEPRLTPHDGRGPHPTRQDRPHPHSVTFSPDNRLAIVCDLGLDRIFTYAVEHSQAKITPAEPPFVATEPGAGPRHFKFGHGGTHAYAINELGNTVTTYAYEAARGTLTLVQNVSTLPAGFTGENTSAELRVHPNGRFLYGSNRGHDSIAVFEIAPKEGILSLVEIVPSGGRTPRNFDLSPDGRWLVCAHQESGNLTVFHVDGGNGRLTRTPHGVRVPMCVCVQFFD